VQVKIAQGKIGIEEPKKVPFREFALEYGEYCRVNKAANSYQRDMGTIDLQLIPFFGGRHLHTIATIEIERYKAEKLDKVKPEALNRELSTIKHLFSKAIEWKYIKEDPARQVKKIRGPKSLPRFIESKEEVEKLLDACLEHSPEIYPLVVTTLHAGMRRAELLNLRWEDVDFGRGTLTVSSREGWHTKNYESRTMPLHEEVRRILGPIKTAKGYVFCRPDGSKLRECFVRKRLDKVAKAADVGHLSLHVLRHTFASHLIMSGVDLPTVQRLMGHKDIKTTMRYAHLAPDHLRMGMAMLDFTGHFMDTKGVSGKISLNQNRPNSLKNRNAEGKI
jgi:site-specific recombinase XerD